MALPHVFTDASVTDTCTTIAIHSPQLGINKSITLPRRMQVHLAEELAYLYARKIVTVDAHFFTDSIIVANKVGINWIPREYNKTADRLSKKHTNGTPISNISHYIMKTYPFATRLRLANRAFGTSHTCLFSLSKHSILAKRLVHSIFFSSERPAAVKKQTNVKTLTDIEIADILHRLK